MFAPLNYHIKMSKKIILALVFFIHFFFIIIYNIKQIVDLSLIHHTYVSHAIASKKLRKIDTYLSFFLPHKTTASYDNDYMNLYMRLASSKTPFNYFSHISPVEKIVFELGFTDGTSKIILPVTGSGEMELRHKCLLNIIAKTPNEPYRDLLVKRITEYEIRDYANVKSVKVVIGTMSVPLLADFSKNNNLDFKYLYQYNFRIK
jgi:hypothetical protein